ncbi:unnamed protein product [Parnassius mnemosyne]|uniref:Uncharacterized protein n=1 Tax=Parnassius mnemosyne TaxID=213953 RepID=A0AAV1LN29_9NEOP
MTVLSKVFCLILLLCILNSVTGDLASFFATLPTEIGNAFSGAWNRITETIRRPVRIKRLGKGGSKNLYEGVINESEKADEESNEGIYNILFFI